MTLDQDREAQRPRLPENQAVAWSPENRLYGSVVLDYVTGMSQHSYWFGKANQSAFRPLLEHALTATNLGASSTTPLAARYGLQIEFKDLEGSVIGTDFQSHSVAVYRIVDRSSNRTVFEREITASFDSKFPGLNEHDAATAYLLSKGTIQGTVADALIGTDAAGLFNSPSTYWRGVYYSSAAHALFGPAVVGAAFVWPFNYVASPNFWGTPPRQSVLGARQGALSESGIGARNGGERERQADYMMMAQSLTKFVIALGDSEHVHFTTLIPCVENEEVDRLKNDLMEHGLRWETDNCMLYKGLDHDYRGLTYTSDK
jgi:hypothetical protein